MIFCFCNPAVCNYPDMYGQLLDLHTSQGMCEHVWTKGRVFCDAITKLIDLATPEECEDETIEF